MRKGSLTVVGVGYKMGLQITPEASASIENAQRFFYLVNDKLSEEWLRGLNPKSKSLGDCYAEGKPGLACGNEMVGLMLTPVRRGLTVCAAFAGHPGIFLYAAHEAVRVARDEGFRAVMLPGVSALDCLFADLGVNPGSNGSQVFAATDFLIQKRRFDTRCPMILLQTGALGLTSYAGRNDLLSSRLQVLAEVLMNSYPPDHEIVIYDRPSIPVCDAVISRVPLSKLPQAEITFVSTLYIREFREEGKTSPAEGRGGLSLFPVLKNL